jgi:hypothetical protein
MRCKNSIPHAAHIVVSEDGMSARIIIPDLDFLTDTFCLKESGRQYVLLLVQIELINPERGISLIRQIDESPELREDYRIEFLSRSTT